MKIRRRAHPTHPGKRTNARPPVNPRNPTGERMSRDGSLGPLMNHAGRVFDREAAQARVDAATAENRAARAAG